MPCNDYGEDYVRGELARSERLLCLLFGLIKANDVNGVLKGLLLAHPDLRQWWKEHQEQDRREAEDRAYRQQQEQLRAKATAKLSPEELKALGVR